MLNVVQMRQKAGEAFSRAEALMAAAQQESRLMTAEERTAYDGGMQEYDSWMDQADALERHEQIQAQASHGIHVPQSSLIKPDAFCISRVIRGMATGNWKGADNERRIMDAMTEGNDPDGGYLVPEEVSAEVIEMLGPEAAVIAAGARVKPMISDTQIMNKEATGPSGLWIAEDEDNEDETKLTYGQVRLVAKKYMVLIPVTNELIQDAGPRVEADIRRQIAKHMGLELDNVALFGGGGKQPLGLLKIPGVTKAGNAVAIGSLSFDHSKAIKKKVRTKNAKFTGWITDPEIWETYNGLKDAATGRPLLNGGWADGNVNRLHGYDVRETTMARKDAGATDTGYLFGGNWNDMIIGVRKNITFSMSEHVDFKRDRVWIKAVFRVDVVIGHPESFSYQEVTGLTK